LPSSGRRPVTPLLAAAMLVLAGADGTTEPPADETAELVTRLDRLLSFIEWPEDTFSGPESPLVIGVVGEVPFSPEAIARRSVGGRGIRVERLSEPSAAGTCHVLWIGGGVEPGSWPTAETTLTVSDREGFVGGGGMVELHPGTAPALDLAALRRSGLGAHPHLLDVSRVSR